MDVDDFNVYSAAGNLALLESRYSGLYLVKYNNPDFPFLTSYLADREWLRVLDIDMVGNQAYLLDGCGWRVVDISTPSSPEVVSEYTTDNPDCSQDHRYTRIRVIDDTAYVIRLEPNHPNPYDHSSKTILDIFDLSTPITPTLLSSYQVLSNNASEFAEFEVEGARATIVTDGQLIILDVSDRENPVLLGETDPCGAWYSNIAVLGLHAFSLMGDEWSVLDVSEPTQISVIGSYSFLPQFSCANQLANYLYLKAPGEDVYLDVTVPSDPQIVFQRTVIGNDENWCDTVVDGSYGYMPNWDGLRILDMSDPFFPVQVGHWSGGEYLNKVVIQGESAYLLYRNLFEILDISDPANPSLIGAYDEPGGYEGFALDNGFAYLGESNGVDFIDIRQPETPTLILRYQYINGATNMFVLDGYLVISSDNMTILNVRNPYQPTLVDQWTGDTQSAIQGDRLIYELSWRKYISYLDFRTPGWLVMENPSISIPGFSDDMALVQDYLYVIGSDNGLQIVHLNLSQLPEPFAINKFFMPFVAFP